MPSPLVRTHARSYAFDITGELACSRASASYTARQTSVGWCLMIGKNALWVAKQHGHSIATMLRAYAAWAEGAVEVDVEAIKRSLNASEAPPTNNLAVDLSVAEALQMGRASTDGPMRAFQTYPNWLFRNEELTARYSI